MGSKTIYFDEAGFTGSDMLNDDQPVFVYASVAIEPPDARNIIRELSSRFSLQGREIKGSNLTGHRKGQEAISWLLKECKDTSRISISNKKYALAGKFFEYIFEPVLAPVNSLFYALEFHLFIANLLYIFFISREEYAEVIMSEFQAFMRKHDPSSLDRILLPFDRGLEIGKPLGQILTFLICHKGIIVEEIERLSEIEGLRDWVLELTTTSLYWLLSYWGGRFPSIEVYCDKSKPLELNRELFNALVGRQDKIYMKLADKPEVLLTYNLAKPICLVDSSESPGIQIADVLASSMAYAFKYPDYSCSNEWISLANSMFHSTCIIPAMNSVDLRRKEPFVNALVLQELVNRTLGGKPLLVDWEEFITIASMTYEHALSTGRLSQYKPDTLGNI